MWIFRDFESQAMQSGSEDPEVANVLQKCEEYVPGKVKTLLQWWIKNYDDIDYFWKTEFVPTWNSELKSYEGMSTVL